MKTSDIAALMKGVAPAVREIIAATIKPLEEKIAALEAENAALRSVDHGEIIRAGIAEAICAIPAPDLSAFATKEDVASVAREIQTSDKLADDAMVLIDGLRVEVETLKALPPAADGAPGRDGTDGADGKDADPEVTAELVRAAVADAVAAIPAPQDGKSVTVEELAPLVDQAVAKAVSALPPAEKGEPGAPGRLPLVKEWTDDVTHEGEVRTHAGATWQALKDTAKEPPHGDWVCLAAAGNDGAAARQIEVRGTYAEGDSYSALNIVALNGGAFIARKDDPGPCPGEGWQVIAMRGKPGEPGKRGDPGPSVRGEPGPAVVALGVDGNGMMTLVNGDGSTVDCDLYPVLSKVM